MQSIETFYMTDFSSSIAMALIYTEAHHYCHLLASEYLLTVKKKIFDHYS